MALILALTFTALGQEQTASPQEVQLKRGQFLALELLAPLDSGHAQVGDVVFLKLFFPLEVDGITILPVGWQIHGRVTSVTRAGRRCRRGKVVWVVDPIITSDGRTISIRTQETKRRAGNRAVRFAKGAALVPVVVLLSPFILSLWIGTRDESGCHGAIGEDEHLPAGAIFSAEISRDIVLPMPR